MLESQQNRGQGHQCPRGRGKFSAGRCHHRAVNKDILVVKVHDIVSTFTHIKVVTFTKDTKPSEFIIVSTLEVVLPIVKAEGEATAAVAANLHTEVTSDAHGAVKAVSRLGEDGVEGLGRGGRCEGRNQQYWQRKGPHDAMSDVSLRYRSLRGVDNL